MEYITLNRLTNINIDKKEFNKHFIVIKIKSGEDVEFDFKNIYKKGAN